MGGHTVYFFALLHHQIRSSRKMKGGSILQQDFWRWHGGKNCKFPSLWHQWKKMDRERKSIVQSSRVRVSDPFLNMILRLDIKSYYVFFSISLKLYVKTCILKLILRRQNATYLRPSTTQIIYVTIKIKWYIRNHS